MSDTATTERRSFKKGSEASKEASKGASFAKTQFFGIDDGESAFVRIVTDPHEWIATQVHANVPTKPKPDDYKGDNWPASLPAVCRRTKMADGEPLYPDCIIDNMVDDKGKPIKTSGRTWALCVLREEVKGDGSAEMGGPAMKGKRTGFRTKIDEIAIVGDDGKPTGAVKHQPAFRVLNMGWKNFFAALDGAAKGYGGTLKNRDFFITRSGKMIDTTYSIVGLDPTPKFDLRTPEAAAKYGFTVDAEGDIATWPEGYDLEEIVMERASDEFYAKFFDRTKTVASSSDGKVTNVVTKAESDPDEDRMAALASRVKGYSQASESPQEPTNGSDATDAASAGAEAPAEAVAASGGVVNYD